MGSFPLFRRNCSGLLALLPQTNYPKNVVIPEGLTIYYICVFCTGTVKIFYYSVSPFHYLSFGLSSIFIKLDNLFSLV